MIVTTEIWIILYNIFLCIYNNTSIDIHTVIKEMLFFEKVPLKNMWYMPMIIGIYIVIPYIGKILKNFSLKSLKIPMLIAFALSFCLPTINIILKVLKLEQYKSILDISFLGGTYGFYLITAYFIRQNILKSIKSKWILIASIISFILSCGIQLFAHYYSIVYNIWYNSPFIFICTVCLFELFTRINCKLIHKWFIKLCTYFSKIALSIFFIHIIIEMILVRYVKALKCMNPIKVILLFLLSFIVSILTTYILSKIKIIKEKVLAIKE